MKMKMMKKCFHFLYSNSTFRVLKMKIEYEFLNQLVDMAKRVGRVGFKLSQSGCGLGRVDQYFSHELFIYLFIC